MKLKTRKVNKSNYNGGRISKSNAELWSRRVKEYRLWSMGVLRIEIARQFNLTPKQVGEDIQAMVAFEPIEEVKKKIDAKSNEVIRTAFENVNKADTPHAARIGYLHIINEAIGRLSLIHGLERPQNNFNLYQTLNVENGDNKYGKWDSNRLREEFNRRRLRTGSGATAGGA